MCGIFGYVLRPADVTTVSRQHQVHEASYALRHRGPDGHGSLELKVNHLVVGFGHRRLSIIDLSEQAAQPMKSGDERFAIVFNGEIYNYLELRCELLEAGCRFVTASDTEVLLRAWEYWGVHTLSRLVGMFAFAVCDIAEQKLYLVRDAFGIKPLYYSIEGQRLAFASEPAALSKLKVNNSEPNPQAIYDYLAFGQYDNSTSTFIAGIEHLPPGHLAEISLVEGCVVKQKLDIRRWWWPQIKVQRNSKFSDAVNRLRALFLESVRLHLRSDVPIGAALSGGIDSSAVVCAIRYLEPSMPIHTFSYVARGSSVDEEYWVDLVNNYVGATSHKVVFTARELENDLDEMISAQGEPFGSTSIYAQYRVFEMAKEAGITVILDGQGADELLAGYKGYPISRMRSLIEEREFKRLYRFIRNWSHWPGRSRREALELLFDITAPRWLRKARHLIKGDDPLPPGWLNADYFREFGVRLCREPRVLAPEAKGRRLSEELRRAITGTGLAALLRHADRNSMHWSIESRVPFLTTKIAEFLLTLPEDYLVSDEGETKYIFRAAMRGIVPDEILDRKDKIGFETPEAHFLRQSQRQIETWLANIQDLPWLNHQKFISKLRDIVNCDTGYDRKAWRMINIARWHGVHFRQTQLPADKTDS